MNNRQCYFIYPRDKNGELTGHSICVMMHKGKIFHGQALCSPNDNFNKSLGRKLAHDRALDSIKRHESRLAKEAVIAACPVVKSENLLTKVVNALKGK